MGEDKLLQDVAAMSFEDALKELEGIVRQLESGAGKLEDSITAAERGALLKRHCQSKLKEARMRVDKIVFDSEGAVGTEPFDEG